MGECVHLSNVHFLLPLYYEKFRWYILSLIYLNYHESIEKATRCKKNKVLSCFSWCVMSWDHMLKVSFQAIRVHIRLEKQMLKIRPKNVAPDFRKVDRAKWPWSFQCFSIHLLSNKVHKYASCCRSAPFPINRLRFMCSNVDEAERNRSDLSRALLHKKEFRYVAIL